MLIQSHHTTRINQCKAWRLANPGLLTDPSASMQALMMAREHERLYHERSVRVIEDRLQAIEAVEFEEPLAEEGEESEQGYG